MNLFRHWEPQSLLCELVVSQVETDLYDRELSSLGIERRVTLAQACASPILRILRNLAAMRKLFREGGYDAFYFNLSNSFTMMYAWMAKRAGIPVRVVHSHCAAIQKSASWPVKALGHLLGRLLFAGAATQCLACSQEAALWMFGKRRVQTGGVRLIHNAVSVERFRWNPVERDAMRQSLGLEGKRVIGTVGRLTEQKNPAFLIRAFARAAQEREDAYLLMIGEGEMRPTLEALVEELGLRGRVRLFGATGEVPKMLWAMDVFCLPSRFEGNPVSVIEAQTAGCMCVVSDRVTAQCQISDNVRFLPIDEGVEEWADAMLNSRRVCPPETAARQVFQNGYDAAATSAQVQALLLDGLQRASATLEGRA